jgi:hypothetical protein
MQGVPSRFVAKCELDPTHELDIRADGVHQWTCGWVMQRSGGGGHGISLAQRSNRYACRYCVERAIQGWISQPSMFEERKNEQES